MRRLLMLAILTLALQVSAFNLRDEWSNYYAAVRDRALATGQTNLTVTQTILVDAGWSVAGIQCATNVRHGITNIVCWTNWAHSVTTIVATNFVGRDGATAIPVDYVSATAIASVDGWLKGLLRDRAFVDAETVRDLGGVDSYLATPSVTNWYWLPDDTGSNAQWRSVVNPPTSFPLLTISQAWARARLPVVTNWTVATNTITNTVYGYAIAQPTVYSTNVVVQPPRTNKTFVYHFTAEPEREPFHALLGESFAAFEDQWWEDPPRTALTWSTSGFSLPDGVHPQTGRVCYAGWVPAWTNAPTNLPSSTAAFDVQGSVWIVHPTNGPILVTTGETFFISIGSASTVNLTRAFETIDSLTGPTNGWPTNMAGCSVFVAAKWPAATLIEEAMTSHGAFLTNLHERAAVVSQLEWTTAPEGDGVWHGLVSVESTNNDVYVTNRSAWAFQPPSLAQTNALSGTVLLSHGSDGLHGDASGWIELAFQDANGGTFPSFDDGWFQSLESITWPTSRVQSVPFPAGASGIVFEAKYMGLWQDSAAVPTSFAGSVRTVWPIVHRYSPFPWGLYIKCPTGMVRGTDPFYDWDGIEHTITVSWASDALGTNAQALSVWHTLTHTAGVSAITGVVVTVISNISPLAAGNLETPAEHRHEWTGTYTNFVGSPVTMSGSYSVSPRFIRPTSRTWEHGQWLFEWDFPDWTVHSP